MARMLKKE